MTLPRRNRVVTALIAFDKNVLRHPLWSTVLAGLMITGITYEWLGR